MAKIKCIKLALIEDNHFDDSINAIAKIKFGNKEVQSESRFQLHFFLYRSNKQLKMPNILFDCSYKELPLDKSGQIGLLVHKCVVISAK